MKLRIKQNNGITTMSSYSNNRRDQKCYARTEVSIYERSYNKELFKSQLLALVEAADTEFIKTHTGRR